MISDYFVFLQDLLFGKRTGAELHAACRREEDCKAYLDFSKPLSVLDLANGSLRPQSAILSNSGHKVIGVDLVNRPERSIKSTLYKIARPLFRWHLPKKNPNFSKPSFTCAKVEALPFKDQQFDLITSMAAFEHFLDIPGTLAESHRVLKPGGVIWICIHVFTTLSGGHNIGMRLTTDENLSTTTPPWDHLRERTLPFSVPLNEWRIEDYVKEFEKHFKILKHKPLGQEGASLLTDEIREELHEYSEMELTCGAYLIVAQKS